MVHNAMLDSNGAQSLSHNKSSHVNLDKEDIIVGDLPSASSKRKSKEGRANSSRSTPRRSRHGTNRPGKGKSSSRSPSRSSQKIPDAEDSNGNKLSLIKADKAGFVTPPDLTTPGATSVSNSSDRTQKSAKLSHRRSKRGGNAPGAERVTSSSDYRANRKTQSTTPKGKPRAPAVESLTSSSNDRTNRKTSSKTERRQLIAPRAQNLTGSSHHRANRKSSSSSMTPERRLIARGARPSKNKTETEVNAPPLFGAPSSVNRWTEVVEATTATDMTEEIEAARQLGREEERNARRVQRNSPSRAVVATASRDNRHKVYKYMVAGLCVLLAIAATVITWQVLVAGDTGDANSLATFYPPTEFDCQAVLEGRPTERQNETTLLHFAVEMDLAVASNVDLDFFQQELEVKIQQRALPLLVGCDLEGIFSIEMNLYIIENALLDSLSVGDPTNCSLKPERNCTFVYLHLDLFVKDEDVQNEVLVDRIRDVFQDEALLQYLELRSVEAIYFNTAYETSFNPSSSPTNQEDMSPSPEYCDAIANRTLSVESHDSLPVVVKKYDVLMDVVLDTETEEQSALTAELEEKIQRIVMPLLAGCANERIQMSQNVVVNALVDVQVDYDAECLPDSEKPCYRYNASLAVYATNNVSSAALLDSINAEFQAEPFEDRLNLSSPFKDIEIVSIWEQAIISAYPSVPPTELPSGNPSFNPSIAPTKLATPGPTDVRLTSIPTLKPSPLPTPGPTVRSTPIPTLQPLSFPPSLALTTPLPTKSPTSSPSTSPTIRASQTPSRLPTRSPSTQPSSLPTIMSSSTPTEIPTSEPSPMPSSSPSICYPPFWQIRSGMKCPWGSADRLFTIQNVADMDECYNACRTTAGCSKFSYGVSEGSDSFGDRFCMGCTQNAIVQIESEYNLFYLASDCREVGQQDSKCPTDNGLFKILDVADIDECNDACRTTANCAKFSVGYNVSEGLNCVGCTQDAVLESQSGFTVFEVA